MVKFIFAEALSGKGTGKIAEELIERGVPTKRGGKWTSTTIGAILSNEKYVGDVIFQKTYTDSQFNRHTNYGEKDQYYIQNHHKAIVSREEFEAVDLIINQRGKEKGIEKGSDKYQNRYPFSGKIICSECGSSFKRRVHANGDNKYIAWCCQKHIRNVEECSMKFVRGDAIEGAFITMMNKLIFGRKFILKPLFDGLKGMNKSESLLRIKELEKLIEKNTEQKEMLVKLMAKGYLEPALFKKEGNELQMEADNYRQQKETLSHAINGELSKVQEVRNLLKFTNKAELLSAFDEDLFNEYVERIVVFTRGEVDFQLKCGITLREGM